MTTLVPAPQEVSVTQGSLLEISDADDVDDSDDAEDVEVVEPASVIEFPPLFPKTRVVYCLFHAVHLSIKEYTEMIRMDLAACNEVLRAWSWFMWYPGCGPRRTRFQNFVHGHNAAVVLDFRATLEGVERLKHLLQATKALQMEVGDCRDACAAIPSFSQSQVVLSTPPSSRSWNAPSLN